MEFSKVLQESTLIESYPRYILSYKGTRPEYKIHDDKPYILALDQSYNPDGKGESVLGINLHYYNGDVKGLINKINKFDNQIGFFGFEGKLKVKKFLKHKNVDEYEVEERKKRYSALINAFPQLAHLIRRYKKTGPKNSGIQSQDRKLLK